MLYHTPDRAMAELRITLKADRERRAKAQGANARRRAAAGRRGCCGGDEEDEAELAAFALGLADVCPRCGADFREEDEAAQCRHLAECDDAAAIAAHAAAKAAARGKADAKAAAANAQEDVQVGWWGGVSVTIAWEPV